MLLKFIPNNYSWTHFDSVPQKQVKAKEKRPHLHYSRIESITAQIKANFSGDSNA